MAARGGCAGAPAAAGALEWALRAVVASGLSADSSAQYCSSESLSHSVLGQSSSSSSCRPRDGRPRPLDWFFDRALVSVSGISARTRGNVSESARSGSALMRVAVRSAAEGPVS